MQCVHKDRCSVRRPYAVHSSVSGFFFGCLFSCVVPGSFAVHSRVFVVSSDSRIVRGCLLVVRLAHPGWKPCHLVAGSTTTSQARQEQLGSAAPPGQPFLLDYAVYASCSVSSSGALGRLPWGTQGFFWDALNKEFSFREEVRPGSRRLLKACPFLMTPSTQLNPRSLKEAGQSPTTRRLPT